MLELIDLARRYGDVVALDGVSFDVRPGQMFGFLGPNGAGKTTTMRIVVGVVEPDRGEARWNGRPVDAQARVRFGYMPEARGLYPRMRVREQLVYFARLHGMPRDRADANTDRWLERLGLGDRGGARLDELSHGNQQRAQLAAALVHDPELLILDEPFSGLDPIGVDMLGEVLLEWAARGVPVVFSSHQLDLVERFCEAVAVVDRGRVVLEGSVRQLKAAGGMRIEAEVVGAGVGWADRLPGTEVVDRRNGRVQLALHGAGIEDVMRAAQAAGSVAHFATTEPSLSQLFREAVGAARAAEVAAEDAQAVGEAP